MSNSSAINPRITIDFRYCSPYHLRQISERSEQRPMKAPSRKQVKAAISQVGVERVLSVPKGTLTSKQRKFAEAVAAGETGAAAYRQAYDTQASSQVQSHEALKLKRHPKIALQIEALTLANEAMAYASATQVRQLVIQSLIQTLIDPDTKAATRVSAAKVLGNVTEVAAFTDRKEITHVKDSSAIRDQIMAQLRSVITSDAQDVDADALLGEIAGEKPAKSNASAADRTTQGEGHFSIGTPPATMHSNQLEQSPDFSNDLTISPPESESDPTEDPPSPAETR